ANPLRLEERQARREVTAEGRAQHDELSARTLLDEARERLLDVVQPRAARHVEDFGPGLRPRRSRAGQRDDLKAVAVFVALDEGAVKLPAVNPRVGDEQ